MHDSDAPPLREKPGHLPLNIHKIPENFRDKVALSLVRFMRFFADAFFKKRYGHRAVVLETVAAIPGMVGAMLKHFQCLRRMMDDQGWIEELLDEAENERMHLMTFIHIAQPTLIERLIVILAQGIFGVLYFLVYICSPYTAHRIVGYLEEEAVISYTQYLAEVQEGRLENVPAPALAKTYWGLSENAHLIDIIEVVRQDECKHRDVNHTFADSFLA